MSELGDGPGPEHADAQSPILFPDHERVLSTVWAASLPAELPISAEVSQFAARLPADN